MLCMYKQLIAPVIIFCTLYKYEHNISIWSQKHEVSYSVRYFFQTSLRVGASNITYLFVLLSVVAIQM